jgi:hypothetical protein
MQRWRRATLRWRIFAACHSSASRPAVGIGARYKHGTRTNALRYPVEPSIKWPGLASTEHPGNTLTEVHFEFIPAQQSSLPGSRAHPECAQPAIELTH